MNNKAEAVTCAAIGDTIVLDNGLIMVVVLGQDGWIHTVDLEGKTVTSGITFEKLQRYFVGNKVFGYGTDKHEIVAINWQDGRAKEIDFLHRVVGSYRQDEKKLIQEIELLKRTIISLEQNLDWVKEDNERFRKETLRQEKEIETLKKSLYKTFIEDSNQNEYFCYSISDCKHMEPVESCSAIKCGQPSNPCPLKLKKKNKCI